VDLSRFFPLVDYSTDLPFHVLHVSHMSVIKGVQYLLAAWEGVRQQIDGKLQLVGRVDRDIRKILGRYSNQGIELVGQTNQVARYYQHASVFVSPSISDAGPLTVLEAMACGTPVIVSDHCGFSELVEEGKNGFVYPYSDTARLSELLLWCYRNRRDLDAMRPAALGTAESFSLTGKSAYIRSRVHRLSELAETAIPHG
jgi:glycosyltransferase involved in cell wall biosynthesis